MVNLHAAASRRAVAVELRGATKDKLAGGRLELDLFAVSDEPERGLHDICAEHERSVRVDQPHVRRVAALRPVAAVAAEKRAAVALVGLKKFPGVHLSSFDTVTGD